MSRRIDVELTSARSDGTWTWRAAGAKEPRGVLAPDLAPAGAAVGAVLRVEADFDLDGVTVVAVLPSRQPKPEVPRLEVLGPQREHEPVTTSLVGRRGDRPGGSRRRDGDERSGSRPPRRDRPGGGADGARERGPRARGERPAGGPRERDATRPSRDGGSSRPDRSRAASGDAPDTALRAAEGSAPDRRRSDHPGGRERGQGDRAARPGDRRSPGRPGDPADGRAQDGRPSTGGRGSDRQTRRLVVRNVHRNALLAELPPEQRPIGEQLFRGGLPAVRAALAAQNAEAAAGNGLPVPEEPVLAIAETLLPKVKAASWRDRAEAAVAALPDVAPRDLRSLLASSSDARDDASRALAATLREAHEARAAARREQWLADLRTHLAEGRLVRALRAATQPPDPTTRLPADVALTLSEAAGAGLSPDVSAERWLALLDAVAESPLRRSVHPVGLPTGADPATVEHAKRLSGRVPALAALLGIAMPPPPGPPRRSAPPRRPPSHGAPPSPPPEAAPPPADAAAAEPAGATAAEPAGATAAEPAGPTAAEPVGPAPTEPSPPTDVGEAALPADTAAPSEAPGEPAGCAPGEQDELADARAGADTAAADTAAPSEVPTEPALDPQDA